MNQTMEYIIIAMLVGIMAEIYALNGTKKQAVSAGPKMLVDTSVLMDGRVIEVAKTGFLLGEVIVPRTVLAELQLLADGSDNDKRARARYGMDIMKELKDILGASFTLLSDEPKIPEGVDMRLLALAKELDAAVLTLDYNLNKVAQVEGVRILNINELAKSLRMSYLPGDEITLLLAQKGQDNHQAIGHLSDGTMVVVDQAKRFIGQTKKIQVVRSLQTDAGRMIFAKIVDDEPIKQPKPAGRKPAVRNNNSMQSQSQKSQKAETPTKRAPRAKVVAPRTRQNVAAKGRKPNKSSAQREAELIELANGK